jgi:hypothetical protein
MKLQLLPDIVEDIWWHGPDIRFSTEVFECFNAIFCLCSVLSNHQAPSRDIARKFISMDRVKHMLSGRYWREHEAWVQAGEKVRSLLHTEPFIQRHLGWVPPKDPKYSKYGIAWVLRLYWEFFGYNAGHVTPITAKKSQPCLWMKRNAFAHGTDPLDFSFKGIHKWREGKHIFAQSGDECEVGSWVFFRDSHVSPSYHWVCYLHSHMDSRAVLE